MRQMLFSYLASQTKLLIHEKFSGAVSTASQHTLYPFECYFDI